MPPVTAPDTLYKRLVVIPLCRFHTVYLVQAGLVKRDRVRGCKYADVIHLRVSRAGVAVTVDGKIVHHIDVYDILPEIISDSLGRSGHGLKETVLVIYVAPKFLHL